LEVQNYNVLKIAGLFIIYRHPPTHLGQGCLMSPRTQHILGFWCPDTVTNHVDTILAFAKSIRKIIKSRIKYYRDSATIPTDLRGQAEMWKRVYNTAAGKGTIDEYMMNWARYAK